MLPQPGVWASGQRGLGTSTIHSHVERRYRCERCAQTFSVTRGTALYRALQPVAAVEQVVTLLAHGCPPQAIVAAFGWDERAVARYQWEAGAQCRRVHEHVVPAGQVALGKVQADELRVRVVGGVVWLATALTVTSRLWLGGAVSAHRDRQLIRALLERVRACGPTQAKWGERSASRIGTPPRRTACPGGTRAGEYGRGAGGRSRNVCLNRSRPLLTVGHAAIKWRSAACASQRFVQRPRVQLRRVHRWRSPLICGVTH